jgi:biopolymer transport protein ExbD
MTAKEVRSDSIRLRRLRTRRPEPQILIAPLIDIVFLLLIFFMLVTRFLSPSIAVALPSSESGAVDESRSRTVTIDSNGDTFLDDRRMTLDEISGALAVDREAGGIDIVRLRADKSTAFQLIIDAMDAIRRAGIAEIAVETSPEDVRRDTDEDNAERSGEVE